MSWKKNRKTGKAFRSVGLVPDKVGLRSRGYVSDKDVTCIQCGGVIPAGEIFCLHKGAAERHLDPRQCAAVVIEAQKWAKEELDYGKILVSEMEQGIRCEVCGMTRDKCICITGGLK